MDFTINRKLVFIDSMQLMNPSLNALVKNLSGMDIKYLSQDFSDELLQLVKQKVSYPYEYMNCFKRFFDDKLPDRRKFFSSLKDKCIREADYLHAVDVWDAFEMRTTGDYHDRY